MNLLYFIKTVIPILLFILIPNYGNSRNVQKEDKDSMSLIKHLYTYFDLDTILPCGNITAYDTVRINGSEDCFIFIEYDYQEGPMITYPWKNQFLLTDEYIPVKYFQAQRYEWIYIFPDTYPFLLLVNVTGKGNGFHELYRFTDGKVMNVYEGGEPENLIRTYDGHSDHDIFMPTELQLLIVDHNKDGINDLIFKGMRLYQSLPGGDYDQQEELEYIFLYDKESGYFKSASIHFP